MYGQNWSAPDAYVNELDEQLWGQVPQEVAEKIYQRAVGVTSRDRARKYTSDDGPEYRSQRHPKRLRPPPSSQLTQGFNRLNEIVLGNIATDPDVSLLEFQGEDPYDLYAYHADADNARAQAQYLREIGGSNPEQRLTGGLHLFAERYRRGQHGEGMGNVERRRRQEEEIMILSNDFRLFDEGGAYREFMRRHGDRQLTPELRERIDEVLRRHGVDTP